MSKIFLDTNVLVYLADYSNRGKQERCRILYRKLAEQRRAVISTQVLQEYFVSVVRKIGVDPMEAKHSMTGFEQLEVVVNNTELIREAIDITVLNRISFWDALILAAAASARCSYLLSEDMQDGTAIRGIRIVNPFGEAALRA